MKKFLIIVLSFLLFSFPVFADSGDIINAIAKEIIKDSVGNIIGYKYVMEGGEFFYQFYDEQIDQLIKANQQMYDKANALLDKATYLDSYSGFHKDINLPNQNGIPGYFVIKMQDFTLGNPQYAYGYTYTYYYGCYGFNFSGNNMTFSYQSSYTVNYMNNRGSESKTDSSSSSGSAGVDMSLKSGESSLGGGVPKYSSYSWFTDYYEGFEPGGGASSYLQDGHYIGYGNPGEGVHPVDDKLNPNNPTYDPQIAQDLLDGTVRLNWRIKIDDSNIIKAIENIDVKLDSKSWFEYLENNSVWDDEETTLNSFLVEAMDKLGVLNKPSPTKTVNVMTSTGFITLEVEDEEDDELYSDTSILVYPISIIKQFFDAVDSVEIDGTMNFPSINVRGETLLEEQEFNFYQMIYDLGLADLHEMYYLVINAGLTLGLVYYAKRKFAEFQNGQKGDAA